MIDKQQKRQEIGNGGKGRSTFQIFETLLILLAILLGSFISYHLWKIDFW